jgi:hypothetical protein
VKLAMMSKTEERGEALNGHGPGFFLQMAARLV